jgi:hypothetical protein
MKIILIFTGKYRNMASDRLVDKQKSHLLTTVVKNNPYSGIFGLRNVKNELNT